MKIFKSQYFFYIILSTLLLVLGISFAFFKDNKSDARVMSAHAKIELCLTYTEKWNVNESYGGYTIYAPSPTLTVTSGTTNSVWKTAKADTTTPDTGVLYSDDATSWYQGHGTISYTLNSNYKASIKLTGPNGATRTSEGGLTDDSGTYTGTMSVYIKTAEKANYYHKTSASGSYVCYKTSTEELYGSKLGDWYNYSHPIGMSMDGWYVGSVSSEHLVRGWHTPTIYTTGVNNFYMNYSYNEYTITFNGNGHTYGSTSDKTCVYESSFTMPQNGFTRVGYKFLNWNTKADGTGTAYYPGTSYKNLTPGYYITLYAQWQPITYTVRFNANGGTGTMSNQNFTYDVSQTLTSNVFTRVGSGLCFDNWDIDYASTVNFKESTGINSSGVYFSQSGYYSHLEMIPFTNISGSSVTLTSNYKVCGIYAYNSSGGFIKRCSNYATTHSIPSGTYYIRIEMNVSDLAYASRGELRVWGSLSSNTVKNLTATDGKTVNLYVHWINETYDLVLDYLDQSTIVTYNQAYTFPTPARTGYIFKGWYQATLGATFSGSGRIPDFGNDGSTNTTIQVHFEAQWEPIKYNIDFLGNAQTSGEQYSMLKQYDTPTRIVANRYRKDGYNHIGWSINEAKAPITSEDSVWQQSLPLETWFRIDSYYIQNTTWTNSRNSTFQQGGDIYFVTGSDVDDGSFSSLINSHYDRISVYSVWEAVDYEIVFNGNGATSGSMENQARIYAVQKTLPNNTFERNGYLFLGWHRDKDLADAGQVEYNNTQSITNIEYYDQQTKASRTVVEGDQVTLYAVWKETWAVHNEKPSGSGSTTDPYLIANAQNLAWLSWKYEEGTSFDNGTTTPVCVQTANIDLSEYEWLPIGNASNSFMGNYDGKGYIITNIQTNLITGVSRTYIGLFGYSKSGTIKNVRIWGSINGNSNVGGILGYGLSVTIENCTNNATVIGTVDAGGIVDYIKGGTITSCYNYGNITGWMNSLGSAGGIVAYGEGVIISKCYSTGTISASYSGGIAGIIQNGKSISSSVFEGTVYGRYSGGLSGYLNDTIITDCYAKAQVSSTTNKGIYGDGTGKITNCIIEINGFNGYRGSDFSNWIISSDGSDGSDGRPLPSGLSWLAIGGTKVTDISQISANYTKF